jgi:hypothetical protein
MKQIYFRILSFWGYIWASIRITIMIGIIVVIKQWYIYWILLIKKLLAITITTFYISLSISICYDCNMIKETKVISFCFWIDYYSFMIYVAKLLKK